MNVHINQKHNHQTFRCYICDKELSTKQKLLSHNDTKHGNATSGEVCLEFRIEDLDNLFSSDDEDDDDEEYEADDFDKVVAAKRIRLAGSEDSLSKDTEDSSDVYHLSEADIKCLDQCTDF